MRFKTVLGIAAVCVALWWGVVGYKSHIAGAYEGTTTIDLREIFTGTPSPTTNATVAPDPVAVTTTAPTDAAGTRLDGLQDRVSGTTAAVGDGLGWLMDHLSWLAVLAAVVVVVLIARRVRSMRPVTTDPQRAYTPAQRATAFERAGHQCEYMSWGISRCTSPGEHADHLYPWSRGGATSLANCVASCAHHNTSKGAKVLAWWKVRWLESRRRRYFPPGVPVKVGQRYDPRNPPDAVVAAAAAASAADLPSAPVATATLAPPLFDDFAPKVDHPDPGQPLFPSQRDDEPW